MRQFFIIVNRRHFVSKYLIQVQRYKTQVHCQYLKQCSK